MTDNKVVKLTTCTDVIRLRGNPTVALGVRSYKHEQYGRIEEPELKITGWEKQPTIADEMSDSIPF